MIKGKVKKMYAILMIVMLVTVASGCSNNKGKSDTSNETKKFDITAYKNNDFLITPQEVNKLMESKNLVLLDCNKPNIYAKAHIKGAVGIGIQGFSSKDGKIGDPSWGTILKAEDLKVKLESLGIDNKKTIVFYSDVFKGPGADGRAVWQLKMAGFNNVKMLVGGLTYWKEIGNKVTDEVPTKTIPTTGVVVKDYNDSYVATKDYVYKNIGKKVIIDTRTAGEFKGSKKAGEPRGGHIKGAINLVWTDLLNKDGTPKSSKEITDLMASVGVKPEDDFVVY